MRERKRAHSQSSRPSEQTVPRRPRRRHGDREPPHPGQHGEEMQQRTCDGQVRSSPRAARPRGRLTRTQRTEPPHPPSQSPPGRQAPRPAGVCPRAISRAGRPKGSEAARSDASRFTPRSAAAAVSSSQPEPTKQIDPEGSADRELAVAEQPQGAAASDAACPADLRQRGRDRSRSTCHRRRAAA